MICRDPCVGAAGQTAPTNGYEPPLKIDSVAVTSSCAGDALAPEVGAGRHARGRGPRCGAVWRFAVPGGGDKKLGFEFYADLIHPIVDQRTENLGPNWKSWAE